MLQRLALAVVVASCAALAGCGGEARSDVSGKVLNSGAPIDIPEDGPQLQIQIASASYSHAASLDKDGSFRFQGSDKQGIQPGVYKVTLTSTAYGDEGVKAFPWLAGLGDPETSGIEFEVKAGGAWKITVDVAFKKVAVE
jgi:hypothetical protein